MHLTARMEQFSLAHICAIVAAAGYNIAHWHADLGSVDGSISAGDLPELPTRPQLDFQLKSTGTDERDGAEISFPLKRKNYDDLRNERRSIPIILVLVELPTDLQTWLHHSERQTSLRHCGYWVSLRGWPATANTTSVTVQVPRRQVFTPQTLEAMMARIDRGGLP